MKSQAIRFFVIAAVLLVVPPSNLAWGQDCPSGTVGCIHSGGGGDGGGGGGEGPGPSSPGQGGSDGCGGWCGNPFQDFEDLFKGGGEPKNGGEGQSPDDLFKKAGLSPGDQVSRVKAATHQNLSTSSSDTGGKSFPVFYDAGGGVCKPQGNSPAILPQGTQAGSDPIPDNGEFAMEETDVTLPFYDLPFVFTRYYRSGVGAQTALGYGWSHSYNQHIFRIERPMPGGHWICKTNEKTDYPDIIYQDARLGRIRFTFDSMKGLVLFYKAPAGVRLRLTEDLSNKQQPWTLDDGSGILLHFDGGKWGDLVSITSRTGHRQDIVWKHPEEKFEYLGAGVGIYWEDPNGYVDHVTDSSLKRTVWFVNGVASIPENDKRVSGTYEYLQCLSLTKNDCSNPFVSFTPGNALLQEPNRTASFDLVRVADANGNGPTYYYYDYSKDPQDGTYYLSKNLSEYCMQTFGADQQSDCRNLDICATSRASYISKACKNGGWLADCMYHTWNGDTGTNCSGPEGTTISCWRSAKESCEEQYQQGGDWEANCVDDLTARAEQEYPIFNCRNDMFADCIANKGTGGQYAFGYLSDLRHNLIKIADGDGRTVVTNTYGAYPFASDFDKVNKHVQGAGTPDATNTMTMEYHDLEAEGTPGVWIKKSDYLNSFKEVQVCPDSGAHQSPAYVVVMNDINGAQRTVYFDASWNRLREVEEDGRQIDYVYQNGFLAGMRDAAGRQVCYERDDFGRPTVITELPSPRYVSAGSAVTPIKTYITYDDAGQVIETVRGSGADLEGTHIIRDGYERPLAVGRAVGAHQTEWTCYSYKDNFNLNYPNSRYSHNGGLIAPAAGLEIFAPPWSLLSIVPVAFGAEVSRPLTANPALAPSPNDVNAISNNSNTTSSNISVVARGEISAASKERLAVLLFDRSGCAQNLAEPAYHPGNVVDVVPSTITTPDGAVQKQSLIGPYGPQDVIVDANGADPQETYFVYDEMGRLTDTGRGSVGSSILVGSSVPLVSSIPGASVHYDYDAAGQITSVKVQDPTNTNNWVPTTFQYDHSGNVKTETGPELTRDSIVDELGHTTSIHEYPVGKPQAEYDPHDDSKTASESGRREPFALEDLLWPEPDAEASVQPANASNVVSDVVASSSRSVFLRGDGQSHFNDDIHGRLLDLIRPEGDTSHYDYDPAGRLLKVTRSGEVVANYEYDANGLLESSTVNGQKLVYTYDGFGRVVAVGPEKVGGAMRIEGTFHPNLGGWKP